MMYWAVAGTLLRRSIASLSVVECSRPPYLRLRAQNRISGPATRAFSGSARVWDKKYTVDHEWIELSSDGKTGTIGISTYAANALGDVVFVELPSIDLEVTAGDAMGAVESVKSASDILTPVSGKILEVNSVLEDKPATINSSPEADGWLARIAVSDAGELDELMDADGYKTFTSEASKSS